MPIKVKDTNRSVFIDAIEAINSLEDTIVEYGWLETASDYPDGTSIHMVAAVHTFGIGVPVRDILGTSFDKHFSELSVLSDLVINRAAEGANFDAEIRIVGQKAISEMKLDFTRLQFTPLAPSTVAAKGHSQTLIETRHLLEQVDYAVINR